ncbi:11125_t:CDS:1 [Diversispora eburnea]|uniref:11125_t:CDS:1 n=1 Tax=Diversispora eburnea TaxID=1213867 RepID=A0A9N9A7C5_9GLOM|nr:11125_t:CDS:1 [Diversispora eburnea]
MAFLWQNPFIFSSSSKIISSYIHFLNDDIKKELSITENEYKHPLFDYPAFLREFNYRYVNRAISAWLSHKKLIFGSIDKGNANLALTSLFPKLIHRQFSQEFCKMLLTRSQHINNFIIEEESDSRIPSVDILCQAINSTTLNNLFRLENLTLAGNFNKSNILHSFGQVSRNIHSLTIIEDTQKGPSTKIITPMESMAAFITVQNKLTNFTLERCIYFTDILPALATQAATLTNMIFRNCWFRYNIIGNALSNLRVCKNLVSLKFQHCHALSNDILKPLSEAYYPKLENFEYSPQFWSYSEWDEFGRNLPNKELSSFLSFNGSNLKELKLGNIFHFCPELNDDVVSYGLNLRTLEVSMDHLENLFPILMSCTNLERLAVPKVSMTYRCDLDYLLPQIGRKMPTSLHHLDLRGWSLTPGGLKLFLNEFGKNIYFLAWNGTSSINKYSEVVSEYALISGREIEKLHMQGACNDDNNENNPSVTRHAILVIN